MSRFIAKPVLVAMRLFCRAYSQLIQIPLLGNAMSFTTLVPLCLKSVRRGSSLLMCSALLLTASDYSAATVTIDYVYDDLNRLERVIRDDGPLIVHDYDDVSNIESITISNSPDSNANGIADFAEGAEGDADNDGIPDAVEIAAELNPNDPSDAALDLDGDGIANIDEYLQGSDINHYHGDLDSDRDLDLGDIVVLTRIVTEEAVPTSEQQEPGHGDVNMDGKIDVGDLVIVRRRYFGL